MSRLPKSLSVSLGVEGAAVLNGSTRTKTTSTSITMVSQRSKTAQSCYTHRQSRFSSSFRGELGLLTPSKMTTTTPLVSSSSSVPLTSLTSSRVPLNRIYNRRGGAKLAAGRNSAGTSFSCQRSTVSLSESLGQCRITTPSAVNINSHKGRATLTGSSTMSWTGVTRRQPTWIASRTLSTAARNHASQRSAQASGSCSSSFARQSQQQSRHQGHVSAATIPTHNNTTTAAVTNTLGSASAHMPKGQQQQSQHPLHIAASLGSTTGRISQRSVLPAANMPQRRRYSPQHFYQNRILDPYVQQAVSPITLRQLVFFGRNMQPDKLLKSANYVRTELPVRLAHRIRDFQNLPYIVGTNPHIELVYDLYWQAFEKLRKVPEVTTLEENEQFCDVLKSLLNDHLVVIPQLALGIMECSKHIPDQDVDRFMNKVLRSRISRRVLAEQHISLTANYNSPNHMMTDRGYIGIIYTHCNPQDIVERTAALAANTCRKAFGGLEPPKVLMDGHIDAEFSYIPDHIEYILYELLKNSMRFVMMKGHRDPVTGELPPIQITVCEGTHEIVFRVSDKGGGIHPEMEPQLWSYSQSPARFANFEKISKMAATVQEQFRQPSLAAAAVAAQQNVDSGRQFVGSIPSGARETDDRVILPPPPPSKSNNGRVLKQEPQGDTVSSLLLDRHARDELLAKESKRTMSKMTRLTDVDAAAEIESGDSAATTVVNSHNNNNNNNNNNSSSSSSSSNSYGGRNAASHYMGQRTPTLNTVEEQQEHQDKFLTLQEKTLHLGIGLPMSKVYAEYWGGELKLFTMDGHGTDAYAKFCKFGNIYENFDT